MRTMELKPDYPNVLRWFSRTISEHSFQRDSLAPIISTIEIVRFIQETDPETLEGILDELRRLQHVRQSDPIFVKYCDTYNPVTNTCTHTKEGGQTTEEDIH